MNKKLCVGLFATTLNLAASVIFVSETKGQVLGEILRRMDAHNRQIVSLQADLTMTKYDATLDIPDPPMLGSIKYLPKSKITRNTLYARIDWKKPVQEQMSVIGDNYTLYRQRLSQVVKGSVKTGKGGTKAGSVLGLLTMSRDEVKANYTYVYIGEETLSGGGLSWRLRLTPKGAASFQLADLWIDADGMPRQVQITEKNKDTTKLLLTNIQKNIKIDPKVFEIKPPPGTVTVPG